MSDEKKLPAPYPCHKSSRVCPYTIRCMEIDDAADIAPTAAWFSKFAAAEEQLSAEEVSKQLQRPKKKYLEEGGCPYFSGGLYRSIVCRAVTQQLHSYVGVKFCDGGRQVYCPIFREIQND